ncbi:hypothetical protein, partial [Gluconobacter sp.]|uniref:hypothetical protein n=1 Tax=Gluconobacter sp. TaxID=1876758 RepID=UPI0039E895C2
MVEHNLDAMLAADWIIDLGPDAGSRGGKVMYAARHPGVLMLRILLRERNFDVKSKWMSPNAAQSDFMRETRGLSLLCVMGMAGATGGGGPKWAKFKITAGLNQKNEQRRGL